MNESLQQGENAKYISALSTFVSGPDHFAVVVLVPALVVIPVSPTLLPTERNPFSTQHSSPLNVHQASTPGTDAFVTIGRSPPNKNKLHFYRRPIHVNVL